MAGAVLVHGAWHGAWCWDAVVAELEVRDVPVVAIDLPLSGLADDVAAARAAIEAAGPGTVVVGHSYGGVVISAAASGLPQAGHLVYLAAMMLDTGEDMGARMAEEGSEIAAAVVDAGDERLIVDPARAHELLFADSDAETVASIIPLLRPMGFDGPDESGRPPAWREVPSTFVVCTEDRAIPPSVQRQMATRAGTVVEWPTDHSPFLTRPADVADLVAALVATLVAASTAE